jgi:hypothetical protein
MRSRFAAFTVAAMTVAPVLMAHPTATYAPACEPTSVSKSDAARAHSVYLSGKEYLDESDYDKAIRYFLDAYAIDCSVHGILRVIASAYERGGDKAAAVDALELYLRRAPTASDREVVERRIKNLREQIVHDEPPVAPSPPSPPPHPTPELAAPLSGPAPIPAATHSPSPSVLPWVVAGVGGAVAIAGGVLAAFGASDISNASSRCSSRLHCAPDVADEGNRGRTLEEAAAVVLPAGAAVLATGVVWRILDGSRVETTVPPAAIVVGPRGYAGIAVGMTF